MGRRGLGILVIALVAAGCGDDDDGTPRPTPTSTVVVAAATATASRPAATSTATAPPPTSTVAAPVATATATLAPTATETPPPTATEPPDVTATPPVTAPPTATNPPRPPEIVAFGVARADDLVQTADGLDAQGRPIFVRVQGQGMNLFVEGRRGSFPIDENAYDPSGASPPGIEILVSRQLGNGSRAVCDYDPPRVGGIPGTDPPVFSDDPQVRDAIADLGCRINDGTGLPRARRSSAACTRDTGAVYDFTNPLSEVQFCLPVAKAWAFQPGDTIVAVRLRDVRGYVSAVREIVVRVQGEEPFDCMGGLGERVFIPNRPASRLEVDGVEGDVTVDDWIFDPLHICAGPDVGEGVHVLALREDSRFGLPLVDGSTLCGKLVARGSFGIIDCDGGVPLDVRAVAEQHDGRTTVDFGLGQPAGTGGATLRFQTSYLVLPAGSTPSDCFAAQFRTEVPGALTTQIGTAEVHDAEGDAVATLSRSGQPFSCESWRNGGGAVLVLPIPGAGTPQAGDVAAALILEE